MLLPQLHEKKAARILYPAPTAAHTQIRRKRLFPIFCAAMVSSF